MSAVLEKYADPIGEIEDDWQPEPPVPIEDDPFFTPEDVERLRIKAANSDPRKCLRLTYKQLFKMLEVLDEE